MPMSIFNYIEVFKRIDKLIHRKATGVPKELATKLEVSESTIYNLIRIMKELNAPIRYCSIRRSYIYEIEGEFNFGFSSKLSQKEKEDLAGDQLPYIS